MRQLKPHQEVNSARLLSALTDFGGSLDASDTGTGKSTTFLALCKMVGAKPAIITRKSVIPAWHDECAAVGVEPLFVTNYEAAKSKSFPYGKVISTGAGEKKSTTYSWDVSGRVVFCFDEVQSCRAEKSLNSKMLADAARRFKTHMASATPFTDPLEAFAIGSSLRLFPKNKFWSWKLAHGMRKDFYGRYKFVGDWDAQEGTRIMDKIHSDIFPSRGCRTRRSEIPGFPEHLNLVTAVDVDDLNAIQEKYLALLALDREEDLARAQEDVPEDLKDLVLPEGITIDLRARQEAEIKKCKMLAEMAEDARDHGEAVAIFLNFDRSIEILREMLKTDCIIRGKQKGEDNLFRHRSIREFRANRADFILVNSAAGGAGVSLHDDVTQKPRTSLISPPWSAIILKQVLGRDHRLGGGFATHKLVFALGTIEERVLKKVRRRENQLDTLLDSDLVVNG